ncbi:hypothetical protein [Leptolyngbya sp. FACHB-16]|nr:hypothetical protein [Leptolyngbya sp. FACHB-16]MBD1913625.1 hypothetical protein [Leptolyngbya sp. FACHB-8]MBD2154044.1 hypothetical protein [Leptolyngbya sp. FACHB-16]
MSRDRLPATEYVWSIIPGILQNPLKLKQPTPHSNPLDRSKFTASVPLS